MRACAGTGAERKSGQEAHFSFGSPFYNYSHPFEYEA